MEEDPGEAGQAAGLTEGDIHNDQKRHLKVDDGDISRKLTRSAPGNGLWTKVLKMCRKILDIEMVRVDKDSRAICVMMSYVISTVGPLQLLNRGLAWHEERYVHVLCVWVATSGMEE